MKSKITILLLLFVLLGTTSPGFGQSNLNQNSAIARWIPAKETITKYKSPIILSETFADPCASFGDTRTDLEAGLAQDSSWPNVSLAGTDLLVGYTDFLTFESHYKFVAPDGTVTSAPTTTISPRTNDDSDAIIYKGLDNGNILVTWYSSSSGKGFTDVYFKIINRSGTEVLGSTKINTLAGSLNRFTQVEQLSNGNIVFTWATDGSNYAMRRFTENGVAVDANQLSLTSLAGLSGSQYTYNIAANDNGRFMIFIDHYSLNYYAMIFDNDGTTPIQVGGNNSFVAAVAGTSGVHVDKTTHIKTLSTGQFLLVYRIQPTSGTESRSIAYKIYNDDGTEAKSQEIIRQIYSWGWIAEPVVAGDRFYLSYSYNDLGNGPNLGYVPYEEVYENNGTYVGSYASCMPTLADQWGEIVTFADVDGNISFMINDMVGGGQYDTWLLRQNVVSTSNNTAPTASSVGFTGTLEVGQTLTGSYSYTDVDTDPESGTTFQWYRSDNAAGLNKAAITSANSQTYVLAAADENKYISFEVTPNDGTDAGAAVESTRSGPIIQLAPEINVKGNNVNIADGDLTTDISDHTDFSSVSVSAGTVVRTFTIENLGNSVLTLSDLNGRGYVEISGTNAADFSVSSQPSSSVAASGSTTFTVTFNPSGLGARTAAIQIFNDDADEAPYNFAISGTGTNQVPTSADFAVTPNEGISYAFATGDFSYSDGDADPLDHVTIVTAPASGTLFIDSNDNNTADGGEVLADASAVSKADLDAGRLKYLSDGSTSSSFSFQVNDGTEASALAYTTTLTVNAQPTIIISTTTTDPTNSSPFSITVTFSESVTGFVIGDLNVGNGTASNFAGSGDTYTADITPAADGTVTVDIAGGVATDGNGLGNKAASQFSITYDATVPMLSINSLESGFTDNSPFTVSFTFSEEVSGFALGDISVTNGVASNLQSSDNITFTADITPAAEAQVSVDVAIGTFSDASGNTNTQAASFSIYYDTAVPTVAISSLESGFTNQTPFSVSFTFSEEVSGFVLGDISVTNGVAGNLQSSDNISYTADITPAAEGEVRVEVAAAVATDQAGRDNTAAPVFTITYDATTATPGFTTPASDGSISPGFTDIDINLPEAPLAGSVKMTISRTGGAEDTNAPHVLTLDQTSSGNYSTTYDPADISNDALVSAVSSDPNDFLVDGAIYSFKLSYQDALGNPEANVTHTNIIYDATAPTVSSVDVPTDGTYVAGESLDFTVNWSESVNVTGNPQLSLTIGGSVVQADYLSGSGSTATVFRYTVQNGDLDTDGITIGTLDLNGGDIADRVFTANLTLNNEGATGGIKVDAVEPVISSVDVPADKTHTEGEALDFVINWSEIVTITGTPELSINIGGKEVKAAYVSGSGTTHTTFRYTVEVGEKDLDGISVGLLALNGGTILDEVGNAADLTLNSIGNTSQVWVNSVIPEVTLSLDVLSLNENGGTAKLTVILSESAGKDVTVELGFSGTAEVLTDYSVIESTALIEAGYTSHEILINLIDESLDEEDETVIIDVVAVSNATEASEQQQTLTITDDDHSPIVIAGQSLVFSENLSSGSTILVVAATDADAGTSLQNWQIISGNPDQDGDSETAFSINANTGEISVNDPDELDRETTDGFVLEVSVSDGTNTSESEQITLIMTDENDIKPVITAGQNFEVVEESNAGTSLGKIIATDGDVTTTTFEGWNILSGNLDTDQDNSPAFAINTDTGELTVNDPDELNGNTADFSLQLTVNDGLNTSVAVNVTVTVLQVNDAPSFIAGQNISIAEDAGSQNFSNWATDILAGPENESDQQLTFVLTTSNDAFFAELPTIDASGDLSFAVADNVHGSVTVSTYLQDDAGTANGGMNKSEVTTFSINVTAVNDVPTFVKGENISLQAGAADYLYEGWASEISAGPANESAQPLSFVVSDDQSDFFTTAPAITVGGDLSFSLAQNASGTVTVTVQLKDNGGTANGGVDTSEPVTFNIIVGKISQEISFAPLEDKKVGQEPILLTASGGDSGKPIVFTISTEPAEGVARLEGNQIILENIGQVTVTARQAGNEIYQEAPAVVRIFNITANELFLPTLFTPNEDGNNDSFILRGGGGVNNVEFTIFDRSNNVVFQSTDWTEITEQGWDGSFAGKKQPMGMYIWVIKGTYTSGQPLLVQGRKSGIVRLLR